VGQPRANAAFYFAPDNYQTSGDGVVGRQSATGGFLRGFIRHGGTEPYVIYADQAQVFEDFVSFVKDAGGDPAKVSAVLPMATGLLARVGTLFRPGPDVAGLAWRRRHYDQRAFSIAGITHTVCETMAMRVIGDLLTGPVQPWDALVCTSHCVRGVVERLLAGYANYLTERFGAEVTIPCQLPVIPLGVDHALYAERGANGAARTELRGLMNMGDDDVAVLYAGRLNHVEKANPVPMYLAMEMAAKTTDKRLHLIQAGQATNKDVETAFKTAATTFAPSVSHHFIDGSRDDLYDKIWAAADIFLSLSDNIQESFGLTPIEAMAAGLPVVVSDYDGYRESVRDGIDGFTIPTAQPPWGAGAEIGFLYDTGYAPYPVFTAATSQSTGTDISACVAALSQLIDDSERRRKMGAAGAKRAAEVYDWRHVVQGHQTLWSELAEIRTDAPERTAPGGGDAHPLAPDPFGLFHEHATGIIHGNATVSPADGATIDKLATYLGSDVAAPLAAVLYPADRMAVLMERLADKPGAKVADLMSDLPPEQLTPFYLSLGWLMKMGLIDVEMQGDGAPATALTPFGVSETWRSLLGSR